MIIKEDGFELTENYDLVLPLGLTLSPGSERTVTSFEETMEEAEYLENLPEEKIFTEETRNKLEKAVSSKLEKFGYECRIVFSTEFRLDSRDDLDRSVILPTTELILPGNGFENLTDCEPDPLNEGFLCFGTVIDGKILSAASENPHAPDDTVIDIGVETADGFTGKGYGTSNAAALAYYLLDPGTHVIYIAEDSNIQSVRIAEKIGFAPRTRELRAVCENPAADLYFKLIHTKKQEQR